MLINPKPTWTAEVIKGEHVGKTVKITEGCELIQFGEYQIVDSDNIIIII